MRPGIQRPQFRGDAPNAVPAPFTPLDIGGLSMWLDGSEPTTFFTGTFADRLSSTTNPTTNLDPLCRWEDKSNNGNHWTCEADATRSTYALSATLNGKTGCNLGRWERPSLGGTVKTWFLVHKYDGTAPIYGALCGNGNSFVDLAIASAVGWRLSFVRANQAWHDSGFTQGTSARCYRVLYSGSNSTFWTASSGTETQRQTLASSGASPLGMTTNMPGQLYEVLVYSAALSAPEIASVHAYLTAKWGV